MSKKVKQNQKNKSNKHPKIVKQIKEKPNQPIPCLSALPYPRSPPPSHTSHSPSSAAVTCQRRSTTTHSLAMLPSASEAAAIVGALPFSPLCCSVLGWVLPPSADASHRLPACASRHRHRCHPATAHSRGCHRLPTLPINHC